LSVCSFCRPPALRLGITEMEEAPTPLGLSDSALMGSAILCKFSAVLVTFHLSSAAPRLCLLDEHGGFPPSRVSSFCVFCSHFKNPVSTRSAKSFTVAAWWVPASCKPHPTIAATSFAGTPLIWRLLLLLPSRGLRRVPSQLRYLPHTSSLSPASLPLSCFFTVLSCCIPFKPNVDPGFLLFIGYHLHLPSFLEPPFPSRPF